MPRYIFYSEDGGRGLKVWRFPANGSWWHHHDLRKRSPAVSLRNSIPFPIWDIQRLRTFRYQKDIIKKECVDVILWGSKDYDYRWCGLNRDVSWNIWSLAQRHTGHAVWIYFAIKSIFPKWLFWKEIRSNWADTWNGWIIWTSIHSQHLSSTLSPPFHCVLIVKEPYSLVLLKLHTGRTHQIRFLSKGRGGT